MRFSISRIFIIINLLLLTTVSGQEFSVSGTLVDENKVAIESSEVILLKDGNIISSTLTDSKGTFNLKSTKGT
jgi:hypothetical protein